MKTAMHWSSGTVGVFMIEMELFLSSSDSFIFVAVIFVNSLATVKQKFFVVKVYIPVYLVSALHESLYIWMCIGPNSYSLGTGQPCYLHAKVRSLCV